MDSIPRFTPQIDGVVEKAWRLYNDGYFWSDSPEPLESKVFAGWDEAFLYFAVQCTVPFTFHVRIDGSGLDGFFEGGDSYALRVDCNKFDGHAYVVGKGLRPHSGAQKKERCMVLPSHLVAMNWRSGMYSIEVAVPKTLMEGYSLAGIPKTQLDLRAGKVMGLSMVLGSLNGSGGTWDFHNGQKAHLGEPYRFYDIRLE